MASRISRSVAGKGSVTVGVIEILGGKLIKFMEVICLKVVFLFVIMSNIIT